MAEWGYTLAPSVSRVSFRVAPVPILLHSLQIIADSDNLSGIPAWLGDTWAALNPQQRHDLKMTSWLLSDAYAFDYMDSTFEGFLSALRTIPARVMRDSSIDWLREQSDYPGDAVVLNDEQAFFRSLQQCYSERWDKGWTFDAEFHHDQFELLKNPEEIRGFLHTFLTWMWENTLKKEWQRHEASLRESADAFSALNFDTLTNEEIVESVTNRDLRANQYFGAEMVKAQRMIFVPTPHLGPYVSWISNDKRGEDLILFGARMPKNARQRSTALTRSELLVRLNALADETRLQMLKMLTKDEEICAQDFINVLELSQSSASRHLRQLTASGYITERRRDVAKCYSLNRDRMQDTLDALAQFMG